MRAWSLVDYAHGRPDTVICEVGPVRTTIAESTTHPGTVTITVDADLTGPVALTFTANEQILWDSRGAGGDLTHLTGLTGPALAAAVGPALGDAVREACCQTDGAIGDAATLADYLDDAIGRLQRLRIAVDHVGAPGRQARIRRVRNAAPEKRDT